MIHWSSRLVLPLVHHLVEESVNGLVPPVSPDVAPADHDLRVMAGLPAKCVVSEPRFHPPRYSDGNCAQLSTKAGRIELAVRARELANHVQVLRTANRPRPRRRLEIEYKLYLAPGEKLSQRSKQRCGPATKVLLSSDQIRVVTSIVFSVILITFTDDGLPPRDRLDTVPAVEITVPFLVCSM